MQGTLPTKKSEIHVLEIAKCPTAIPALKTTAIIKMVTTYEQKQKQKQKSIIGAD